MPLKFLSWNIWCDGHFDLIREFLAKCDADIVGLQEVLPHSRKIPVIELMTELGYEYVYFKVMNMPIGSGETEELGNAIFSRYPIVGSQAHKLSDEHARIAGQADIDVDGAIIHVLCTHLKHTHQRPSDLQELQARNLIKALPGERTIVVGDFNATPDSAAIKMVSAALSNPDARLDPTWIVYPEGCDVCKLAGLDIRLDYIFMSKDLKASGFKVESSKGSDHLPISVVVEA